MNDKSNRATAEIRALDMAHAQTIETYRELIVSILDKIQVEKHAYSVRRAQLVQERRSARGGDSAWSMPVVEIARSFDLVIADLRQCGHTCDITLSHLRVFTIGLVVGQRVFQWHLHTDPDNLFSTAFDDDLVRAVFSQIAPTLRERVLRQNVMPTQVLMGTLGALIHDGILTQNNVDALASISWAKEHWLGVAVKLNKKGKSSVLGLREGGARTYEFMRGLIEAQNPAGFTR